MGKNRIRRHHRRSIRLKGYDYARSGAYFVTVCVEDQARVLGDVLDGRVRPNEEGCEVARCWMWLAERYPHVRLDEWIVMPDHLRGIIVLTDDVRDNDGCDVVADPRGGVSRNAPTDLRNLATKRKPLGRLIGAFKTVSTRRINELRDTPGAKLWRRNYYEHTIRDDCSLDQVREYIANNPSRWGADRQSPR